jgi:hypothetical protein
MVESAISRNGKHISWVTTISMTGDVLMLLSEIRSRTTDDAVRKEGERDGQDFTIDSNAKAYDSCPVFTECLTGVVLPDFNTTSETMNLQNFPDVLFCGNCS